MKTLLLLSFVSLTSCTLPSCTTPGSVYQVETPEGFKATARTTSDTDEVMFRMVKNGDAMTVELYKLGADNSAAFASRDNATKQITEVLESAVPLMLRGTGL